MSGNYEDGGMTMAQAAVLMERGSISTGPSGPSALTRLGRRVSTIMLSGINVDSAPLANIGATNESPDTSSSDSSSVDES